MLLIRTIAVSCRRGAVAALRVAVLSVLALACVGAATAQVLKVAVIDAPPFGMKGADGAPIGAAVDVAVALGKRVSMAVEPMLLPRVRIPPMMTEGQADLAGMVASPAADAIGHRLAPMQPLSTIILSRPGGAIGSLAGLEGKTIATLRGAAYDPRIADNPAIRKQEISSYNNGLNLLMAGRVDAVIGPEMGLYFEAAQMGLSRASFAPPLVVNSLEVWLYLSKASPQVKLRERLEQAAQALVAEGFIDSSMRAYVR
ncbi:substrate-binding periplasmic protein [Azospirillum griseum]|uniref:Transporter substrate-binding domain-containing protein n=1 Tax=Azospirillum griseum TaxID=2496639 RepID=A0A3S0JFS9_9PROT|nr:transporter substrate-binding domain-containing protein [Azospirillum griseum]RTR16905.1 transporter substrate-binding domain-containing protein [Azospirillum griseum]